MPDPAAPPKRGLPLAWYVLMASVLIAGATLYRCDSSGFPVLARLSSKIRPDAWWRLLGVLLMSIPISHLVVSLSLRVLRRLFQLADDIERRNLWPPAIVGACESILYPAALLLSRPEFVAVWLGLKIGIQWPRWGLEAEGLSGKPRDDKLNEGRRRYTHALVGNLLTLFIGVITYAVLKIVALVPRG